MATQIRNRQQQQQQQQELARWDPFTELQRVESQLSRIVGDVLPQLAADAFMPAADIEETEDAYIVDLELPGVEKGDIDISTEGRRLRVTGERKEKERTGVVRRRARTVGRFEFEMQLPSDVDENNVSASLNDGVLTVRIPKAKSARPHKIEVQ